MAGYGKTESPTVVLVTGGTGLVGKAINKVPRPVGGSPVGFSSVFGLVGL